MSVAVLPFFMMERPTFLRERANGAYGVGAWVLANFLCSLPGLALISILSTVCVVPLAGLNGFGVFFAALLCSLIAAEGFMNLIGAVSPHYIIGIALGAGVYGFFMLCEGAFKVQDDIPPWFLWVHHIGFHTYSYRVFMYNEFHTIEKFDDGAPFKGGMDLLKFYSFDTVDVGRPRPPHLIPSPRQASPDHCCIPLPCYIHPLTVPHPLTMLLYPRARWAATSAPSSAGASSSRSASPSSYASSTPDVAEGYKKGWWDTRRGAAGDGRKSVVGRAAGAVRSG